MKTGLLADSVGATAKRLGICRQTLYNEIKAGRILTFKIGNRRLISEEALQNYIARLEAEQSA